MNYDTSSIEREIEGARDALGESLSEAQDKVREVVDWRTHFRRNPLPFLAGAAAVGYAASMLMNGKHRTEAAGFIEGAGSSARHALASTQVPGKAGEAFERLADAFIAVGTTKVAQYLDAWIPGFDAEFGRRG
jgi:hypothetical protein